MGSVAAAHYCSATTWSGGSASDPILAQVSSGSTARMPARLPGNEQGASAPCAISGQAVLRAGSGAKAKIPLTVSTTLGLARVCAGVLVGASTRDAESKMALRYRGSAARCSKCTAARVPSQVPDACGGETSQPLRRGGLPCGRRRSPVCASRVASVRYVEPRGHGSVRFAPSRLLDGVSMSTPSERRCPTHVSTAMRGVVDVSGPSLTRRVYRAHIPGRTRGSTRYECRTKGAPPAALGSGATRSLADSHQPESPARVASSSRLRATRVPRRAGARRRASHTAATGRTLRSLVRSTSVRAAPSRQMQRPQWDRTATASRTIPEKPARDASPASQPSKPVRPSACARAGPTFSH